MCYLKNVMSEENLDLNNLTLKQEETPQTIVQDGNQLFPDVFKPKDYFQSVEQHNLSKLFELISKNNKLISNLNQSLYQNSQQLKKITIKFENDYLFEGKQQNFSPDLTPSGSKYADDEETLCSRLFGPKSYEYSLEATQKFEETIYKERNFKIGVRLVNGSGKKVKNNNLLTLCFSICSSDAEWIHENRVGDPFMKGKTETELFKGEAQFEKLHPREVSRIYPNGKVAIVIYPKSSSVKYLSSESSGQNIDSNDIRPLIIENILIRAKKTQ